MKGLRGRTAQITAMLASAAVLVAAAPAQAHDSRGWFWTPDLAAQKMVNRYSDVASVRCTGYGQRMQGPRFRHFRCSSRIDDGSVIKTILHVTSRNGYVIS